MAERTLPELFVVDRVDARGIQAQRLSDVVQRRRLGWVDGDPGAGTDPPVLVDPGPFPPDRPALALVPEDRVVPGRVYPAADGGAPFALPAYGLETVAGLFTTRLRWRRPDDDPAGPIAYFTVGLSVTLPVPAGGGPVREIDHQATARLVQQVRVDGAADRSTKLAMPLGAVQRTAPTTAVIRYGITEKAEFDALWQAITDPDAPATLELSCPVVVGRRTWRQIFRPGAILQEQLHDAALLTTLVPVPPEDDDGWIDPDRPPILRGVERDPHPTWSTTGLQVVPRTDQLELGRASRIAAVGRMQLFAAARPQSFVDAADQDDGAAAVLRTPAPVLDTAVADPGLAPTRLFPVDAEQPQLAAARTGRAFLPADVERFRDSDVTWRGRRAVPIVVISDDDGEPVVITVTLPGDQTVGPFAFPVETNAYMFDVPGDLRPTTTRLLLRHEFDPGGSRARLVYYQDTAFADRYYYEPQQFRVPRAAALPNLPLLAIAFSDLLVQDGDGPAEVRYTARLRYEAVPDLDPVVLAGLRRQLTGPGGGVPDLSALLPDEARIRLQLPDDDAGGALVGTDRTLTREAFDDGFSDEIELSPTELAAVVALLQTDGVRGAIDASLVGAGHTEVPVLISLRDAPAVPLQRAYRGPVGGGLVRVSVTNPLESPIEIVELYRSPAGAGVFAFPQANPGLVVPAGGTADLDYRLDPPGADVDDIEPLLRVLVRTDLHALLPRVMVNAGWAADTFDLTVSCDAGFFGQTPTGAPGPLTAVLVEFEGGVQAVLAAAAPSKDVKVRLPILAWLLRDPDGQRYRYRVTNLHGVGEAVHPGAVGGWIDGTGGGTLSITPVGA